jgi:hypothetical protein
MITSVPNSQDELPASPALAFSIQPNPARDALLVRYNISGTNADFNLFNALGVRVLSAQANSSSEIILDVSALRSGMYLLSHRNGAATATQTVMIVR